DYYCYSTDMSGDLGFF
nr:immunoglobulin light chain junction region [Macaca mulatta]MOX19701.1 immunoglobulin light chain junction region [Macaca mulatta]MOX20067.1 immunoglobulin light chain junction region [Macaca mulatta]MOX20100.1 immunoglobulin light chain junction region [Macaca mulatta]MOX20739.1 immunoglobulin light chain junction region [Macaca mulatta]